MGLTENLICKRELRFHKDGSFKILMLSDIQETLDYDARSLRNMDALIDVSLPFVFPTEI